MSQMITKYLGIADLQKYENHIIPYGPIGSIVDTRTYLRWVPKLNRRETPLERWQRVINYNLSLVSDKHSYNELRDEALYMLDMFVNMKADVSGRTKWVGGTDSSLKSPQGNFNCSFTIINRLPVFSEIFGLLMNGCGVGFRVFSSDICNLPRFDRSIELEFESYNSIPKEAREDVTHTVATVNNIYVEVGDSRKGWMTALDIYLKLVTDPSFTQTKIVFNLDSIRPIGERINGFGGTASGPDALRGIIEDIHQIIQESNQVLNSLDCMDIVCAIAKGVVAGSSRRSALISLFEQGDTAMSNAKVGLYTNPELIKKSYRSQSNNTVCLTSKPTLEDIQQLLHTCKTEGEPGFNNYSKMIQKRVIAAKTYRPENPIEWYTNVGTNPCFAAGTMVLTKDGHYPIEDLIGKTVEVHDGNGWVEIDNFRVTGSDQEVYKVTLHSGQTVTATAYHKFVLEDGTVKELRHLVQGDKLLTTDTTVDGFIHLDSAYLKGFLVGDGTQSNGKPILHLYYPKYVCENRLVESANETINTKRYGTYEKTSLVFSESNGTRKVMGGLTVRRDDFLPWVTNYRKCLPDDCLNWDNQSKYEFIAGVLDADGTAQDSPDNGFCYQMKSIAFEWLKSFQLLLKSVGVESKVSLDRPSGTLDFGPNRGGICNVQTAYRLSISQVGCIKLSQSVVFSRLTSFADKTIKRLVKSNFSKVVSIEFAHIADEVYCCNVPTNNRFTLSNSLIVGNCHEIILSGGKTGSSVSFCNLTTLPLPNFVYRDSYGNNSFDMEGFEEAIRLNTRISMRQTCVEFDSEIWTETQSDERLLGVSLTGCQDMFSMMGWKTSGEEIKQFLISANTFANDEADKYSIKLGIPRPLLVTTLKPEGTSSTIFGTSSGLHWDWAPYYIRRVRMTSKDALAQTLLKQGFTAYPEIYDLTRIFNNPELTGWDCLKLFDDYPESTKLDLLHNCNTIVFEFPCKSNSTVTQSGISAIEQLESVKTFTKFYTDHMPSSTISVKEDEWDDVAVWIDKNWDDYITASFFPYYGGSYPLLPLEAITEDVYKQMLTEIPEPCKNVLDSGRVSFVVNETLLSEVEREMGKTTDDELGSDCQKGLCPVR